MTELQTENLNHTVYSAFWNKLQQAKFDIVFYNLHFNRCVKILRNIKYTDVALTTLSTLAWMQWNNVEWVSTICPIIILLLQVATAVCDKFPFEQRKQELRELSNELDRLYIQMENDWMTIYNSDMTNRKIQNSIQFYSKAQAEIKDRYLKDDTLPENEKIRIRADNITQEYFNSLVGGTYEQD